MLATTYATLVFMREQFDNETSYLIVCSSTESVRGHVGEWKNLTDVAILSHTTPLPGQMVGLLHAASCRKVWVICGSVR